MLQNSSRAKIKTLLEAFDMAAQQPPEASSASAEAAAGGSAAGESVPTGAQAQAQAQAQAVADGRVREGGGGAGAGGECGGGGGRTTAVRKQHAFALMALALSNSKDKHEMPGGAAAAGPDADSDSEGVRHQMCRLQLEVSLTLLPPQRSCPPAAHALWLPRPRLLSLSACPGGAGRAAYEHCPYWGHGCAGVCVVVSEIKAWRAGNAKCTRRLFPTRWPG